MGQYDEAIAQYNKVIDICPKEELNDLAIFYQNIAAANEQLKNYSFVKAYCTKALELNSRYTKALLRRARVLEQTGDLEAAFKDLIIACIHDNFSNKTFLAKIRELCHKLVEQQARENLAKSLKIIESTEFDKLPPSKLEVLLLRATFYVLSGDYISVIQDFESLLNSEDVFDDIKICVFVRRANLYMQLEMLEIAFKDFELAIGINPRYGDIYYQRGQIYLLIERLCEAKRDFEKAVECNSNFGMAYLQTCYMDFSFAYNNMDIRLVKVAVKKLERAFKKFPNPPESIFCCNLYADVHRHNFHKADACLVKAIQKYPEHAYVYETRGALQFKHDNINKAIKCFNKAIELDYKCEIAYKQLGKLEMQRGNIEEAIKLFDKSVTYCKIFKEQLEIYNLREAAKIELYIKNQLGGIPWLLREFTRFIDIEIAVELLNCLIS
ncbi:Mitochondrial import receptor subunit TOM70 [Atta colombica]|uniref:Mitochondrial import receptor subunit TOM70 n=1 Tax=Atta colombica TaxID=520822 RepID=A0A195B6A3_9HYME|nr:Mitochondrial import receptor subunit TOM70 [Atta colombica]